MDDLVFMIDNQQLKFRINNDGTHNYLSIGHGYYFMSARMTPHVVKSISKWFVEATKELEKKQPKKEAVSENSSNRF